MPKPTSHYTPQALDELVGNLSVKRRVKVNPFNAATAGQTPAAPTAPPAPPFGLIR